MSWRVASFMEGFPARSETYILWHMTELIRAGHDVTLYPVRRNSPEGAHDEVSRYNFMERVVAPPVWPDEREARAWDAFTSLARAMTRDPMALLRLLAHATGDRGVGWPQIVRQIAWAPIKKRHDVAHAYFGPPGRRAQFLRDVGMLRAPLVVSFLGFDLNVLPGRTGPDYYGRLFEGADCLCVSSRFMRRKLLSLGAPEERIRVLPIGLPLKGFAFRPRQLADGETMTLIAAARLTEVKGISWGLKGLALAREAGLDVRWEIFGDGPLRAELEALRAELGLEDAVTFHGFVPIQEVQRAMETAHACLFPGVAAADGAEEALGGAVLEAQACGLPVIASEVGGIPEGFVPGVSGYLVPQRDPEAIAKALRDLHDNREQWPTMGEAGHAHVQERYDCEALNERWERLYDGLVAGTLPTQAEIDAPLTRSTKG